MNPHILWLEQANCQQTLLVGGKAAQLSRLAATYPVPTGFCVTTDAFRARGVSETLRGSIANAYEELAEKCGIPNPPVAVRSSSVDEDGAAASFAGQFESYLNVIGAEAVLAAIEKCWETAVSERVLAYRQQQGLTSGKPIAVLVQQLVMADVSSVVFSANPVSGNRQEIVINASWGLGESVVSGEVTPDTFTVHKSDLTILTRTIADKQQMTVPAESETRSVTVPRFLRQQSSLNDEQILEMSRLARQLESEMGWAVDIECAYHNDTLYLLQCRPITTLK